jgi:hypothetical protein
VPTFNQRQHSQQNSHGRSASSVNPPSDDNTGRYQTNADFIASIGNTSRQSQQPSTSGSHSRSSQLEDTLYGNSYNDRDDRMLRPEGFDNRSRSSTVSSS